MNRKALLAQAVDFFADIWQDIVVFLNSIPWQEIIVVFKIVLIIFSVLMILAIIVILIKKLSL